MSGKPNKQRYQATAEQFWRNLTNILHDRNLKWVWLADQMHCEPKRLSVGKALKQNVTIGTAAEIAKILGVDVGYLINNHEVKNINNGDIL